MTRPDQLVPVRRSAAEIELEEVGPRAASQLRSIYWRIWQSLATGGRTAWSEVDWRLELERPGIRSWLARVRGVMAGFAELDVTADGDVGVVVFGLLPEFQGQGFGGAFLTLVTEEAWAMRSPTGAPTRRVWLQTSSEDHPHALTNYKRRGFRAFDTRASEDLNP